MKKIYLEKLLSKGYVVLEENFANDEKCSDIQIAALMSSFASLGFSLTSESINILKNISSKDLDDFYRTSYKVMSDVIGANANHVIFYRNFPHIEHIEKEEYWLRAILHYVTSSKDSQGFMNQDIEENDTEEVITNNCNTSISIISLEEANKLLIEMVVNSFEQKVAIPQSSYTFLFNMLNDYPSSIILNCIPFKENIATYINLLTNNNRKKNLSDVLTLDKLSFIDTATDLLRVYSVLSGFSPMLVDHISFVSLPRPCRRLFLFILENIAIRNINLIDDLARHEFYWKKAFEKLHVGEYEDKYPHIYSIASDFRNDRYQTFYSKIDLLKDNLEALLSLLSTRPGEFARRLDYLLRYKKYDANVVLQSFSNVADKVSSTVLIQLWGHFKNRNMYDTRIFKINKNYSSVYVEIDDLRQEISCDIIDKTIEVIENALTNIYANYPMIENVYVSDTLKNYALPTNNRNASGQYKTLTFGTRINLKKNENSFIRLFTHWKNMEDTNNFDLYYGRVDIDLSVELISEDFKEQTSVSWHNMAGGKDFSTYHSGDVTTAPNGASEFIDLNYMEAAKHYRYVLVANSVYTGQSFAEIPECFSGVMFLPAAGKSGKVFKPSMVKYKFDLTQNVSNQNIAFVIDLKTMEMIWIDCPLNDGRRGVVAANNPNLIRILKDALKSHMNLYDFIMLHKKHLTFTDNKEDANIVISDEENADIKPFDTEIISSKWL